MFSIGLVFIFVIVYSHEVFNVCFTLGYEVMMYSEEAHSKGLCWIVVLVGVRGYTVKTFSCDETP